MLDPGGAANCAFRTSQLTPSNPQPVTDATSWLYSQLMVERVDILFILKAFNVKRGFGPHRREPSHTYKKAASLSSCFSLLKSKPI